MSSGENTDADLRVGDGRQIGPTAIPIERSETSDPRRPAIGAYKVNAAYTNGLGAVILRYRIEKSTKYGKLHAP